MHRRGCRSYKSSYPRRSRRFGRCHRRRHVVRCHSRRREATANSLTVERATDAVVVVIAVAVVVEILEYVFGCKMVPIKLCSTETYSRLRACTAQVKTELISKFVGFVGTYDSHTQYNLLFERDC